MFLKLTCIVALCSQIFGASIIDVNQFNKDAQYKMHPYPPAIPAVKDDENDTEYWLKKAQQTLAEKIQLIPNTNIAKNVILFMGDGMSIPTIAATRVYLGGEEAELSFDKFPHTALSKTYCVDYQVADSACSATAYLCGVKGNLGTIGVNGAVPYADCNKMNDTTTHTPSIAAWSQAAGKKTGLVTTATVTHASPGGVYAHTAQRDWECDSDILAANEDPKICHDIAHQIVNWETGSNLEVILGGGRAKFLPREVQDEQGNPGERSDGVNLINQWLENKRNLNKKAAYVWNRTDLLNVPEDTEYLLGLFNPSYVKYHLERDDSEPTLEEMTEAAIKMLSKGDKGYFLFVEGARIDMGHHDNLARKALDETSEFSKAIQKAVDITNEEDTLIVVTADHAHTLSYSGYPLRGNDILGVAGTADDNMPFATLGYANGPGYRPSDGNGKRHNISNDDLSDINYQYPSMVPLDSETHGGDDVGIFARGPWAHLFAGVVEQNVIPAVMAYASCVGEGATACDGRIY